MKIERPWRRELDLVPTPELILQAVADDALAIDQKRRARERSAFSDFCRPLDDNRDNPRMVTPLAEDPGDEFNASAARNHNKAFELDSIRQRRLATAFTAIVAKIAEDLSGWPVPGDDEWSVDALLERRLSRKPLSHCRQSRDKNSLVLILDSSGSCLAQARFYSQIASAATSNGDIELFDAPNAGIRARRTRSGWQPVAATAWPFNRRTIVFFGDFDGGDTVVEASRTNTVYWFSSETRYPHMWLHPWCTYSLRSFQGRYFPCASGDDFLRLLRKVR